VTGSTQTIPAALARPGLTTYHDAERAKENAMPLKSVHKRIAWVDLGRSSVEYETPDDDVYLRYLGGYGLGAYYLATRQPPKADPLGPDNLLAFLAGPLTGTKAVTGNRFVVAGKSPKTGGFGDANCGGRFGPAFKQAGLDAVFFKGIAEEPVLAVVQDGEVRLEDAGPLWGRTTSDTEAALKEQHGKKAQAAVIGPAGERVSALACIINDEGRAAGRSGLGMVMGAKRIKAVVAVGEGEVPVADPDGLSQYRRYIVKEFMNQDNRLYSFFHELGTPGGMAANVRSGDAPVKNWAGADDDFPDVDAIDGPEHLKYKVSGYGCWKCPIACGAILEVDQGPYASRTHRPEYETLGAFGSMCLNSDLPSIVKCNELCNEYGLDTISAGATVAFAMECCEKDLLSREEAGLDLQWGDPEAVVEMTRQLAQGHGPLAEIFGHGVHGALMRIGPEARELAMECGGEELPMHDPRCFPGLGASYVADATPGRHTQMGSWNLETGRPSIHDETAPWRFEFPEIEDPRRYAGKGPAARFAACFGQALNAAGLCHFYGMAGPPESIPRFLSLAMGGDFDPERVLEIGHRIATLRMAFNVREGIRNPRDYKLPGRVVGRPPLEHGPTQGVTVDHETEIREFFEAMGWSPDTGAPRPDTLRSLGLDFMA
jgi:aldehyde:ferredoxin oxidoreductase